MNGDEGRLPQGPRQLLWFSHLVPYPPTGGALQRSFNLIRQLSRTYQISLVAFNLQGDSGTHLREYSHELKKYCDEVDVWELPVRWRSTRWWTRLLFSPLFPDPYTCRAFWSRDLLVRWRQTLRAHREALLHFDSPDLALFMPAASGFRKVLNHHNCESMMARRRAQQEPNPLKRAYLASLWRKLANLESNMCPRVDVNIVVSEVDARVLRETSPAAHIHVVENGTDSDYFQPLGMPQDPSSLIFVGSLDWYPNISAIQLLVRQIWPLVKARRPEARLYIVGRSPSKSLSRWLTSDPSVNVVANPADVRPWLARATVFVCPIVDGGGTRLKILDALAAGKAVVSTTIGCEGLRVKPGTNILIADSPEDFARETVRVLDSDSLRRELGAAGRSLVETTYAWEIIAGSLEQAYGCALNPDACAWEYSPRRVSLSP